MIRFRRAAACIALLSAGPCATASRADAPLHHAIEARLDPASGVLAVTDRLTLGNGPASIFDTDGSAVVIHEKADDQRTDPTGNSGDRVLCGPLVAGPTGGFFPRP